ncbi:hypothetical protein ACQ4PT_004621 [Festuca glaucescens]
METVEGLLRNLKLSAVEKKRIDLGGRESDKAKGVQLQVMGRVLSEKPVYAEGLAQSLGRAWSPLKEVKCKDMGGNIFLFTFPHEAAKRKVVHDGPWMTNNDMIVMVEFHPDKALDDYVFDTIPIWIRVMKLPLGWMNRDPGLEIGDQVGEGINVEVGEDGNAVGEYLRIKVRIKTTQALMRGIIINLGENNRTKWCPFEYEYLPEFCYTCGVLGHDDKGCSIKLSKGEKQQLGGWLRAYIPKKYQGGEKQRWSEGKYWVGGRGYGRSYGFRGRGAAGGSNNISWRKDDASKETISNNQSKSIRGEEVASPLKLSAEEEKAGSQKKLQFTNGGEKEKEQAHREKADAAVGNGAAKENASVDVVMGQEGDALENRLPMHDTGHFDRNAMQGAEYIVSHEKVQGNGKGNGTFRRRQRKSEANSNQKVLNVVVGQKKEGGPMEVEDMVGGLTKKVKSGAREICTNLAGLSE